MQTFSLKLSDHYQELGQKSEGVLDAYIPDASPEINPDIMRPSILICPGGAYMYCSRREAEPIALNFVGKGYNVFVLYYSVFEKCFPYPQLEVLSAIRMIRENAAQWHCAPDKIAVMGFSAGGHLAACASNLYNDSRLLEIIQAEPELLRPNASILCYAVISGLKSPHELSFERLLGEPDEEGLASLSLELRVDEGTPPAFIWHTSDDGGVSVNNSLLYASALAEHNIPFEMHIFPHGIHGLANADRTTVYENPVCAQWIGLCLKWLDNLFYNSGEPAESCV